MLNGREYAFVSTHYAFLREATQRERTHTKCSESESLVFIARKSDLSVGVQMAARAPFVSLFSGVSIGGKGRRNGGTLDVK